MKYKSIILGFTLLTFPVIAFGALEKIKTLLRTDLIEIIKLLVPVVIGIAMIYFFWGVGQFILHNDEKTREEGKKKMLWGVIALFVMFSINGILSVISDTIKIPINRP